MYVCMYPDMLWIQYLCWRARLTSGYQHWCLHTGCLLEGLARCVHVHVLCGLLLAVPPPPITQGLVGWFTAESYMSGSGRWLDMSGSGRHAWVPFPEELAVRDASASGPGALKGRRYVRGSTFGQVLFPEGMLRAADPGYTLFHVARYDGPVQRKIWTAADDIAASWSSGFDQGRPGVANYFVRNGDGKQLSLRPGEWLLSTHRQWPTRKDLSSWGLPFQCSYSAQGVPTAGVGETSDGARRLCINCEIFEESDWAVAAVLVYINTPSGSSSADPGCCSWVRQVEDYLASVYGIGLQRGRTLPCGYQQPHDASTQSSLQQAWQPVHVLFQRWRYVMYSTAALKGLGPCMRSVTNWTNQHAEGCLPDLRS